VLTQSVIQVVNLLMRWLIIALFRIYISIF